MAKTQKQSAVTKEPTPAKKAAAERAAEKVKAAEQEAADAKGAKAKAAAADKLGDAKALKKKADEDAAAKKKAEADTAAWDELANEVDAEFDALSEKLVGTNDLHKLPRRLQLALRLMGRAQEAAKLYFQHAD